MGQILYVNSNELPWAEVPGEWEGKVGKGEPDVRFKLLSAGHEGLPTTLLAEYEPGHHEKAHSHPTSEILYVLEGEVSIGDVVAKPGTAIFIERNTIYGPVRGGPRGARFLRVEF